MNIYDLPTSVTVCGVKRAIRTDFRAVIDVLKAMKDPELDNNGRNEVLLRIMYPGWKDIPPDHMEEAAKKACEFIDCGQKSDGKKRPRMIDWEQDAPLIIPAVNNVAHTEVRAMPDLHWWTFFGWFMEIGDSVLSNVLHIRNLKYKRKKLSKPEQEWYNQNRALVDFEQTYTQVDKDTFKQWGV